MGIADKIEIIPLINAFIAVCENVTTNGFCGQKIRFTPLINVFYVLDKSLHWVWIFTVLLDKIRFTPLRDSLFMP